MRPEHRGRGYGRAFLNRLAALAAERGCGRLEWWCLEMGAEAMSDWTVYRITGERLKEMAEEAQ